MMAYIVCLMWVYCTHIGIARENVICYNVNREKGNEHERNNKNGFQGR